MKITKPMKPNQEWKIFYTILRSNNKTMVALTNIYGFRYDVYLYTSTQERYADGKSNIPSFYSESPGCQNCLFFPSKYTVYHPKILSNSSIKVWYATLKILFIFLSWSCCSTKIVWVFFFWQRKYLNLENICCSLLTRKTDVGFVFILFTSSMSSIQLHVYDLNDCLKLSNIFIVVEDKIAHHFLVVQIYSWSLFRNPDAKKWTNRFFHTFLARWFFFKYLSKYIYNLIINYRYFID